MLGEKVKPPLFFSPFGAVVPSESCDVTEDGGRVTFAGDPAATSELVRSGTVSTHEGIGISKAAHPAVLRGTPHR